MRYLKKYNEELKPETYLSAAQKLQKLGHQRRPQILKTYAEEIKQRQKEERKAKTLEEAKKLGEYDIKFGDFVGRCYIYFSWINDDFDDYIQDFKSGDGSALWLRFSMGFIPVDEETLYSFNEAETRTGYPNSKISSSISPSDNGVWWMQDFGIILSKSTNNINNKDVELYTDIEDSSKELIPTGEVYMDGIEFPCFYFADRANAQKFKTMLYKLFNSEIFFNSDTNRPGGMVEMIREELVGEYGFGFNEYIRFVESMKRIRVNNLYKD